MNYILFAYIAIAGAGGPGWNYFPMNWQPMGEFKTFQTCENARSLLGKYNVMRCVEK